VTIAALAVLLLVAVLAWASRGNLNADGVSYLDLADHLRLGDAAGFVQGYWSPAYPLLLAVMLALAATSGHDAAALAHLLNSVIAAVAIVLIWRAGTARGPAWGVLILTAFLVCSARTVRVDPVTPDLLLLLAIAGFGIELLRSGGWRCVALGIWAGAAFLARTSTWPWLLVSVLLLAWHAWPRPESRRQWRRMVPVALACVLGWSLLVSFDTGRVTLGSAAGYDACWYLRQCDGRSPDTHGGTHAMYSNWLIADGAIAKVASSMPTGGRISRGVIPAPGSARSSANATCSRRSNNTWPMSRGRRGMCSASGCRSPSCLSCFPRCCSIVPCPGSVAASSVRPPKSSCCWAVPGSPSSSPCTPSHG
jgi:hypothetical protein